MNVLPVADPQVIGLAQVKRGHENARFHEGLLKGFTKRVVLHDSTPVRFSGFRDMHIRKLLNLDPNRIPLKVGHELLFSSGGRLIE